MPMSKNLSRGDPKTELTKPESDLSLITSWQGATIDIPIEEIPTTGKTTHQLRAKEFMMNVQKWLDQTDTSWAVLSDHSEVSPDTMRKVLKVGRSLTYRLMQKMAIVILANWDGLPSKRSEKNTRSKLVNEPRNYFVISNEEILRRREAAKREIIERERYWLKQERIRWGVPKSSQISIWEMAV